MHYRIRTEHPYLLTSRCHLPPPSTVVMTQNARKHCQWPLGGGCVQTLLKWRIHRLGKARMWSTALTSLVEEPHPDWVLQKRRWYPNSACSIESVIKKHSQMHSTAKYHFLLYLHAFPTLFFLLYSPGLVTLFMQWETLIMNLNELWWLQSSVSIWCSWFLMQEK